MGQKQRDSQISATVPLLHLITEFSETILTKAIIGFYTYVQMVLYDVVSFKKSTIKTKNRRDASRSTPMVKRDSISVSSVDTSITQKNTVVNSIISKNSENDTKFSAKDDSAKWEKIEPTEKTKKVLDKLADGKYMSLDIIEALKEIREAYTEAGSPEPTINDNSPERQKLRKKIQADVEKLGSARLDESGKWVYDNSIRKEKRIDIVIGLPAAGKSSVFVDPLSSIHSSRVVDSDVVKERLPEFNNGYGAETVHKESKLINKAILENSLSKGENIVLPIVGSKYEKVLRQIQSFKDKGYSVHLHLNELSAMKALGRMLTRFFDTGRFLDPALPYEYQSKPTEVFNRIIAEKGDLLDGYSHYSNDVKRGEKPIFIRGTEKVKETYDFRGNESKKKESADDLRGSRRGVRSGLDKQVNSGYQGYSMSKRAASAYANGEMPLSRWSKEDILSAIRENLDSEYNKYDWKQLNVASLRSHFLKRSSWHHTSSKFNKTDFYSLNYGAVESLTTEVFNDLVDRQKATQEYAKNNNWTSFVKCKVSVDVWEGSKRYPKKVTYTDMAIVQLENEYYNGSRGPKIDSEHKYAYTYNYGRKSNFQVLETYPNKVPSGTTEIFKRIQASLPQKYQDFKKFKAYDEERHNLLALQTEETEQVYDESQINTKHSLREEIDIARAKKAFEENKKLNVLVHQVNRLFKQSGKVLDYDAMRKEVAKPLLEKYYF